MMTKAARNEYAHRVEQNSSSVDSAEYWSEATPEKWKCIECGSASANVGVGFSLYETARFVGSTLVSAAPTAGFWGVLRDGKSRMRLQSSYWNRFELIVDGLYTHRLVMSVMAIL